MNPTREQITQARNLLIASGASAELASLMGPGIASALETILAATVEPTFDLLAKEADRAARLDMDVAGDRMRHGVLGYVAGVRRAGAR